MGGIFGKIFLPVFFKWRKSRKYLNKWKKEIYHFNILYENAIMWKGTKSLEIISSHFLKKTLSQNSYKSIKLWSWDDLTTYRLVRADKLTRTLKTDKDEGSKSSLQSNCLRRNKFWRNLTLLILFEIQKRRGYHELTLVIFTFHSCFETAQ